MLTGEPGIQAGVEMKDPKHLGTAGVPRAKPPSLEYQWKGGNKSINMNGQKRYESAIVKHTLWALLLGRLNGKHDSLPSQTPIKKDPELTNSNKSWCCFFKVVEKVAISILILL